MIVNALFYFAVSLFLGIIGFKRVCVSQKTSLLFLLASFILFLVGILTVEHILNE